MGYLYPTTHSSSSHPSQRSLPHGTIALPGWMATCCATIAFLATTPRFWVAAMFTLLCKPQTHSDKPFRLLDLPRELRDQIYEHALSNERRDFWFFDRPRAWCILPRTRYPNAALFQVSKQIRSESIPIYWSLCHLDFMVKFSERQAFLDFLYQLQPAITRYLLRNPDVHIRVIFDKACSEYREYKESELPGQIASTIGSVIYVKKESPIRKWVLISEHPDTVDSSSLVKIEDWAGRPIVIMVHPDLLLRMLSLLDLIGAETTKALRFNAADTGRAERVVPGDMR